MAKGGEVRWGLWYRSIRPLAQEVREDGACGAGRHDRWCRWWRLSIIGAGRCRLRRRWYASLARVDGVLGAGEVFGWGPAPQNGLLRFPVAQVLPLFPHLRHLHLTPAPAVPHTCASCTPHLRQLYHLHPNLHHLSYLRHLSHPHPTPAPKPPYTCTVALRMWGCWDEGAGEGEDGVEVSQIGEGKQRGKCVAKWRGRRAWGRKVCGFGGFTKIILIFADREGGDRVSVVGYFLIVPRKMEAARECRLNTKLKRYPLWQLST